MTIIKKIILYLGLAIFLKTNSHNNPVESNNKAATIKSNKLQETSVLNCMATNGTSSIKNMPIKIILNRLFSMVI